MSPHTTHKNMIAVFGNNKFAALADEQDIMDAYEQVQRMKQLAEDRIWQAKATPSIFIVEDDEDDGEEWSIVQSKRGPRLYEVVREDETEYVEDVEANSEDDPNDSDDLDDSDDPNDSDDLDDSDDEWWYTRDRVNSIDDLYDYDYDYNPYDYDHNPYDLYANFKRSCDTCQYYYNRKCPDCEYLEQDYIPLVDPENLIDEHFESYFDEDYEDYIEDPTDFVLGGGSCKGSYRKRERKQVKNKRNSRNRDYDKDKVDLRAIQYPLHSMKSGRKWFVDKDYNIVRNKIWKARPKYWRRMRATRQSFRERVEDEERAVMDTENADYNYDSDYDYSDYSDYSDDYDFDYSDFDYNDDSDGYYTSFDDWW